MSTTQNVLDSTGTNLANATINWNDSANSNYREQFISILNAANQTGQLFGTPLESDKIGNIDTEIYMTSSRNTDLPIYTFARSIICSIVGMNWINQCLQIFEGGKQQDRDPDVS